jgi:hypothetical protein
VSIPSKHITTVGVPTGHKQPAKRGTGDGPERSNNSAAPLNSGCGVLPSGRGGIEIPSRLHFTACPTCGIAFALPIGLHLHRQHERGSIWCPNGHAHALAPAEDSAALELLHADALNQLANLAVQLRAATAELATLRPAATAAQVPDREQVVKRMFILQHRAPADVRGRQLCRFCGRTFGALKKHLLSVHYAEVEAMPAAAFDTP